MMLAKVEKRRHTLRCEAFVKYLYRVLILLI